MSANLDFGTAVQIIKEAGKTDTDVRELIIEIATMIKSSYAKKPKLLMVKTFAESPATYTVKKKGKK